MVGAAAVVVCCVVLREAEHVLEHRPRVHVS
jgi:hypothetical protein